MTPKRPPRRPRQDPASNFGTMVALMLLLLVAAGLIGLIGMVMGGPRTAAILIVVTALFIGFFVFHYVVWGWWLSNLPYDDEDDDD